jgi:hypothetical protein
MIRMIAVALFSLTLAFIAPVGAEDKKKDEAKTFEGVLVCAKCTLKEAKTCSHALKVKEKDKEVIYYVDDKGGKESYHKGICPADSEAKAKVTGKVEEKDGKKWIKDAKVEIVK